MADPVQKSIRFTVGDGWAMKVSFSTRVDGVKTPRPVTTSTFLSQVRRRETSDDILASVTIFNSDDIPSLDTNQIILVLYSADTLAIARDAVWDLEETALGADPQTKLAGFVYARPQVSHA